MKNDTKEKRMLDILDRLANGEISPQKADELLKQADYADENGQGGGNYENAAAKMNADGGPNGAEEALLAVAEEYFPQDDDDDDDDDEEYGVYEEAEDIISGVTPLPFA